MKKKIIRDGKTGLVTKVLSVEDGPSLTQQHHKDAHDVNQIMKKYQKVGIAYNALPPSQKGVYGDFSAVKTFQQAQQMLIDAQNSFNSLPSSVRKKFSNSPSELFEFLNDKKNKQEAIALGLIPEPAVPEPAPTPTPVPPSNPS